jgi:hypothetical protein
MRRILALFSLTVLMVVLTAAPALGQNNGQQSGLVNVNIGDVTVTVPVAAAVNLCDVDAAVLLAEIEDTGSAECDATAGNRL